MKLGDYYDTCKAIHADLANIAELTYVIAVSKCANQENPQYVDLMKRQVALIKRLVEIDRKQIEYSS